MAWPGPGFRQTPSLSARWRRALSAAGLLIWPLSAVALDVGPGVGARIPTIQATDSAGKRVDIRSLAGRKGVVLVFFRSAKWCGYCQRELIEYRAAQAPLEARGYALVGLSYDSPEVLTDFAAKQAIGYRLISDPGSATIDAFSLRDPAYKPGSFAYGVPREAIFVISRQGVVQARQVGEDFRLHPDVPAVLAMVDAATAKAP